MKRSLTALSGLALALSLAACDSNGDDALPAGDATASSEAMAPGTEIDAGAAGASDDVVVPDESVPDAAADGNAAADVRAPGVAIDSPSATIDASGVRADPGSVRVATPDVRVNGKRREPLTAVPIAAPRARPAAGR